MLSLANILQHINSTTDLFHLGMYYIQESEPPAPGMKQEMEGVRERESEGEMNGGFSLLSGAFLCHAEFD